MTTLLLSAAQTVIHLQCAVPFVLPQSAIDTNTRGTVSQIKAATKAGKAKRSTRGSALQPSGIIQMHMLACTRAASEQASGERLFISSSVINAG